MLDAVRAELIEADPADVLQLSRLAPRIRPERLEEIEQKLVDLVTEIAAAEDPEGEPIGMLLVVHRRR